MNKTILLFLFFFVFLSGCTVLDFNDTINMGISNSAYMTIYLQDGSSKNGITVQIIDIKTAIFKLTDPVGGIQSNTWTPGSNTVLFFKSYRSGLHTLQLTDIDTNNVTNTANATMNLKVGYNYRILAVLGGAITVIEVTNTNTFVFDPAKALVLYSETYPMNVVWGTPINNNDITTNTSPSDPNNISFVTGGAGEGTQCFKIHVNSNMFNVNWLRWPIVDYLDMRAYTNGTLRMMIKGTKYISISIHMVENYDIMVHLTNDGLYGYYTNNTWCNVVIPMSEYVNRGVDLMRIYGYLKFYGGFYEEIAGGEDYYIDNVFFYKE